jgi:hypothetical protein
MVNGVGEFNNRQSRLGEAGEMISPSKMLFAAVLMQIIGAWAAAAAPSFSPRTQTAGNLCYVKTDGAPSAFDTIDVGRSGAITADIWRAYYARKYLSLEPARKAKTPLDRYLKYAGARFKGLDKDRSGTVTCAEYKASIEKLKSRRLAKAALPPAPAAAKPPAKTRQR